MSLSKLRPFSYFIGISTALWGKNKHAAHHWFSWYLRSNFQKIFLFFCFSTNIPKLSSESRAKWPDVMHWAELLWPSEILNGKTTGAELGAAGHREANGECSPGRSSAFSSSAVHRQGESEKWMKETLPAEWMRNMNRKACFNGPGLCAYL